MRMESDIYWAPSSVHLMRNKAKSAWQQKRNEQDKRSNGLTNLAGLFGTRALRPIDLAVGLERARARHLRHPLLGPGCKRPARGACQGRRWLASWLWQAHTHTHTQGPAGGQRRAGGRAKTTKSRSKRQKYIATVTLLLYINKTGGADFRAFILDDRMNFGPDPRQPKFIGPTGAGSVSGRNKTGNRRRRPTAGSPGARRLVDGVAKNTTTTTTSERFLTWCARARQFSRKSSQ